MVPINTINHEISKLEKLKTDIIKEGRRGDIKMKVAVSASGPDIESKVDEKFGRCPYFILVEILDKKIKSHKGIENTSIKQMTGAGTTAAQLVADMGVDVIITSNMGPRAFEVFQQLDIDVYEGNGVVKKAVQDFIDGKLQKMESAKCPKHL